MRRALVFPLVLSLGALACHDAADTALLSLADSLAVDAGGSACVVPDSLRPFPNHWAMLPCTFADPVRGSLTVQINYRRVIQVHRQWNTTDSSRAHAFATLMAKRLDSWGARPVPAWPGPFGAPPSLWTINEARVTLRISQPRPGPWPMTDSSWSIVVQANPVDKWGWAYRLWPFRRQPRQIFR